MPAYNTTPARALYPGDVIILSNAAITTPFKTQQWCAVVQPGEGGARQTINNPSAVTAVLQYATNDVDAQYAAVTDGDTGIAAAIAAGGSASFAIASGFYRLVLSASAGASVITVSR